jgi:hypothetical protein
MVPRGWPVIRLVQAGFIVAAIGALWAPLVRWNRGAVNLMAEKRAARPWPKAPRTRAAVRAWPAAVEAFVQDRIGLRDAAVRAYNGFSFFALRTSPLPDVARGRHGWLFYRALGELASDAMADARRSQPLGPRKLNALVEMILARERLVSSWGGRYLFVVAPNKSSIYPEELPSALTPIGRGKPLDQLAARLTPAPAGALLDLTPALLAAKGRAEIYYRTDSHWNQIGALHGLIAIMKVLRQDHPGLSVPDEGDLAIQRSDGDGGDLAVMLNLAPMLPETRWQVSPGRELALPAFQRKLKVWVYADSFYAILPHLWMAYLPGIAGEPVYRRWSEEELRAGRPDVVIQLVVERRLRYVGRDPAPGL